MKILAIPDLIVPAIDTAQLATLTAAAGPDAEIVVADTRDAALAATPDRDIIFGLPDEELVLRMPGLRWIQATSSGMDSLMFPAVRDSAVVVTGEKGMVGSHLADHAMALLLAVTRRVGAAVADGPGSWDKRFGYRLEQLELEGLTLGILGFGGTGRALARRAAGFDMKVRALDVHPVPGTAEVAEVEPLANLQDLLSAADAVAVCLPLTGDTARMIDAARIAAMKPGTILLNVTRGEIVDHPALVEALRSGHLGGAGLDVHHLEPLPADDPLWQLPTVVMTPHTAGASQLRAGRNIARFAENLLRFRKGDPLLGLVDKALGY